MTPIYCDPHDGDPQTWTPDSGKFPYSVYGIRLGAGRQVSERRIVEGQSSKLWTIPCCTSRSSGR